MVVMTRRHGDQTGGASLKSSTEFGVDFLGIKSFSMGYEYRSFFVIVMRSVSQAKFCMLVLIVFGSEMNYGHNCCKGESY